MKKVSHLAFFVLLLTVTVNIFTVMSYLLEDRTYPRDKEYISYNKIGKANCNNKFSEEEMEFTYSVFAKLWNNEFGKTVPQLKNTLSKICVEFDENKRVVKNVHSIDGVFYKEHPISGETLATNHIWLYWPKERKRLSSSSMVHELVHVTLMLQGTNGDPDHEGEKIQGGWTKRHTELIEEVNAFLLLSGI